MCSNSGWILAYLARNYLNDPRKKVSIALITQGIIVLLGVLLLIISHSLAHTGGPLYIYAPLVLLTAFQSIDCLVQVYLQSHRRGGKKRADDTITMIIANSIIFIVAFILCLLRN